MDLKRIETRLNALLRRRENSPDFVEELNEYVSDLKDDKVVTGDGIVGAVTKVIDDNEVAVEIADGVKVRVQRGLISSVMAKTD